MFALALTGPVPRTGNAFRLSRHALERLSGRGIRRAAVQAALRFGRVVHVRGAVLYVIGRREVETHKWRGVNLIPFEGVQVVCSPSQGVILTTYRCRDFRGLRPRHGSRRARYRSL